MRSLKQPSQNQYGDVSTRTGRASKQQYFPFCLFTGCGSVSLASQCPQFEYFTSQYPAKTFFCYTEIWKATVYDITIPILLTPSCTGSGRPTCFTERHVNSFPAEDLEACVTFMLLKTALSVCGVNTSITKRYTCNSLVSIIIQQIKCNRISSLI